MISIILPTFNRAHVLPLCLNSLINQDYPKNLFEIIIVDNNSKDNTKEVVEQFIRNNKSFNIKYLIEKRQGLVFARHAGANIAQYETLVYTDDDAVLSSNWLSAIAKVYELNSNIVAVGTKILIRWDKTPPAWVIDYEPLLGSLDYGNEIIFKKNIYINGGSFSIKKNIFNLLGGFNPDQVGDWLIGDGESGLCHKLHEKDYLIGWTPFGVMEHLQFVNKNATVKDIKRRYYNNGIGVPYRLFVFNKANRIDMFRHLFKTFKAIYKEYMRLLIYIITKKDFKIKLNKKLEIEYLRAQIIYILHILTSASFRKYIRQTNWF